MNQATVAYFTMEMALESTMSTYAGGLGVLAGDTIRSAADLKVPLVAVTLLHRKGYFKQHLDASGWQQEAPSDWDIAAHLQLQQARTSVSLEGRTVQLQAWKYEVHSPNGFTIPIFFLDTDLPENQPWDRTLTHFLYGGGTPYRLCQEVILGIGGIRMLRALGFTSLSRYHMNEGHAALLGLELLDEAAAQANRTTFLPEDLPAVRKQCVFTTHTPIASGHDLFPLDLALQVLGRRELQEMQGVFCCDETLNMTFLALNLSHYINGVAKKHAQTSQLMFGKYEIDAITNGVHAATWTSPPFQALFDRLIPGWRADNFSLRFAHSLALDEIKSAHLAAKQLLLHRVFQETGLALDPHILTLGFARRATAYKRIDLLVSDVTRLNAIAASAGPLHIICAGKAHPNDHQGKEAIQRLIQVQGNLSPTIKLVYLPNYDLDLAKLITAGVDVWLNTPHPPFEASGTSGMKAALNGVPSLSVLDGWWLEGWIEGETGWSIGESCPIDPNLTDRASCDATALYRKLENEVIPLFYQDPDRFADIMRHCISLNGSFFNTQRMVSQYVIKAYFE